MKTKNTIIYPTTTQPGGLDFQTLNATQGTDSPEHTISKPDKIKVALFLYPEDVWRLKVDAAVEGCGVSEWVRRRLSTNLGEAV